MLFLIVLLLVSAADSCDCVETTDIICEGFAFDVVVAAFDRLLVQALVLVYYFRCNFGIITTSEVSRWIFFLKDRCVKVKPIVKLR